MNHLLHHHLAQRFGVQRLHTASVIVDNARTPPSHSHQSGGADKEGGTSSSLHKRSSVLVYSHANATRNSNISRWESCATPPNKGDLRSPLPRRPRRNSIDNALLQSPERRPRRERREDRQAPKIPVRQISYQKLPPDPAPWKDDDILRSPVSVRAGLDGILGRPNYDENYGARI